MEGLIPPPAPPPSITDTRRILTNYMHSLFHMLLLNKASDKKQEATLLILWQDIPTNEAGMKPDHYMQY